MFSGSFTDPVFNKRTHCLQLESFQGIESNSASAEDTPTGAMVKAHFSTSETLISGIVLA